MSQDDLHLQQTTRICLSEDDVKIILARHFTSLGIINPQISLSYTGGYTTYGQYDVETRHPAKFSATVLGIDTRNFDKG